MSHREQAELTPLPFPLPPAFAEQLGYRRGRRFVACYWDAGDEVTVRDDSFLASGMGDWYPWVEFFRQPAVSLWQLRNDFDFGSSEGPPKHWLIIDRATNQGFVAETSEAYECIQQQRIANLE